MTFAIRHFVGVMRWFGGRAGSRFDRPANAALADPADPVAIDEPGRTVWTKVAMSF